MALSTLARLTKTSRLSRLVKEIDVALAVAQLHVGQAVKFFGQREHGFGQETSAAPHAP
jgi:hypothetical protein